MTSQRRSRGFRRLDSGLARSDESAGNSDGYRGHLHFLPPAYTAEALRVSAGSTYLGDNSKARSELGFQARPLEEGLRQTLRTEMDLLAKH